MIRISDGDIKLIRGYANRIIGYCEHVPIEPIKSNATKIIEILDIAEEDNNRFDADMKKAVASFRKQGEES